MPVTWAYVAGLFDGEGSVSLDPDHSNGLGYLRIRIGQSGEEGQALLSRVQVFLITKNIRSTITDTFLVRRKVHHTLTISAADKRRYSTAFLAGILPHLILKKAIVQDVLRFFKLFPPISMRCGPWKGSLVVARRFQFQPGNRS